MIYSTINNILITMITYEYLTLENANSITSIIENYDTLEKLEFIEQCGFKIKIFAHSVETIDPLNTDVTIEKIGAFQLPKEMTTSNLPSFKSIW